MGKSSRNAMSKGEFVMRQSVAVGELKYQRTVIGYHGCDESVARNVLLLDGGLPHAGAAPSHFLIPTGELEIGDHEESR